jgi:uncharacterized protein (DUF169 family)
MNMPNYAELASILTGSLNLQEVPVAVSFRDHLDGEFPKPSASAPAGCAFWQQGARGVLVTDAQDHRFCAIGMYTHQLEMSGAEQADLTDALKVLADLTYVQPGDLPLIPVLQNPPKYVLYGPLASASAPEVVLLFVRPNQSLILAEAVQQVESAFPIAMGRPACAVIPQCVNSGRAAISFGCCGARAYMDIFTDDIAICALPGANLEAYVDRVAALARANAMLGSFHQLRRRQIQDGGAPSIQESLAAFQGEASKEA